MESRLKFILFLASVGMIASWLSAWSGFLMTCMSGPSFGMMGMFFILISSAFVSSLHRGKGWRVISILILHSLYLLVTISWTTYILYDISTEYWDIAWIITFMEMDRGLVEWTVLILSGILVIALWIFGIRLAGNMDEDTVSGRFDAGLAMLTLLLLVKLLIKSKGGSIAQTHDAELNILYFFFFGLFAVGLIHYEGSNKNHNITYYKSSGIIITFTIIIFILGGLFSTLLLPCLTASAEMSYSLIKTASRPLLQAFVFIIRILFVSGCRRPMRADQQGSDMNNEIPFAPSAIREEGLFMVIFRWSMVGIGSVILLFLVLLILYYLYRILSSRTKKVESRDNFLDYLLHFILFIKSLFSYLLHKTIRRNIRNAGPEVFYKFLLHWGIHSGLPPMLSETPTEYGSRLGRFFPSLRNEINHIIDIHNRSLYGKVIIEAHQLNIARLSWKSLRSPFVWPLRIKTWFGNPGAYDESLL